MVLENRAKRKEPKQVILPRMKNEKWFFPLYAVKRKESKKVTLSRMNVFSWLLSLHKIVNQITFRLSYSFYFLKRFFYVDKKVSRLGALHRNGRMFWMAKPAFSKRIKSFYHKGLFFTNFKEDVMNVLSHIKTKKGPIRTFQRNKVYHATKHSLSYCFLLVMLCLQSTVFASKSFYADTQRGYFWFETPSVFDHDLDPFDPSKKETPPRKDEMAWSDSKYKTARDALKAFQDELEEKKAHFVLKPTTDSALSYLKIQKAMLDI